MAESPPMMGSRETPVTEIRFNSQVHPLVLHHDDHVDVGDSGFRQVEEFLDVDHRHDLAAHVHDAAHKGWRAGQESARVQGSTSRTNACSMA